MSILHEICKGHSKWVRMAQKFDYDNAEDLVQEMYIKIHNLNPTEVNEVYIYRTIKSIFVDGYKKKKILTVPLNGKEAYNVEDDYNEDADFSNFRNSANVYRVAGFEKTIRVHYGKCRNVTDNNT